MRRQYLGPHSWSWRSRSPCPCPWLVCDGVEERMRNGRESRLGGGGFSFDKVGKWRSTNFSSRRAVGNWTRVAHLAGANNARTRRRRGDENERSVRRRGGGEEMNKKKQTKRPSVEPSKQHHRQHTWPRPKRLHCSCSWSMTESCR